MNCGERPLRSVVVWSIFLMTFLLEDVALAATLGFITRGELAYPSGFLACFLGISLGDIGLYWIGVYAARWSRLSWFQRRALPPGPLLTSAIVLSRVMPGARLPTYVSAGIVGYPFARFCILTLVSVALWVSAFFWLGRSVVQLSGRPGIGAILFTLALFWMITRVVARGLDPWDRRAWFHSWRRYGHFEFWPAWLFYMPIGPWYLWLSWRHRDLFAPFFAQPQLTNGGLIGESKWDFLRHLPPRDPATLITERLPRGTTVADALVRMQAANLPFPLVMKPDVGQRGFGVRVVHDAEQMRAYLEQSGFDVLLQRRSQFQREAGIFYVRPPGAETGHLFSITDKRFPVVIGDGKSRFGDLILADRRARVIAGTYFARHRARLNEVLARGEIRALTECGNHCQGAIFLDGANLISAALTSELDILAKRIPDFRFGRFDVRYASEASLRAGRDFEIVEINGAGSEATHIWDARTKLGDAYAALFRQWSLLFEIGASQRQGRPVDWRAFLKEVRRVVARREPLSVSS